jgi:hypothetical protein
VRHMHAGDEIMSVSLMTRPVRHERTDQRPIALLAIDPFLTVSAFGGGIGLLIGLIDLPRDWLGDTPFDSYAIPGVVLLVVVGGAWLIATLSLFVRHPVAPLASIAAGVVQLGWFAVQVAMLGYISWMQPFIGALAVIVIVLAHRWRHAITKDPL